MMHGPGRTEPLRRIRSDAGNATASSAPPRILAVGALLCCAFSGLFGAAEGAASETAADEDPRHAEEPAIDEEVVVRGRQRSVLRAELRLAEEALYSRFNEINSRDEFDVHCRNEKPMNSQIPRRVCVPRFWTETHASIGRDAFLWITEGYSGSADPYLVHAQTKQALFDEELRRLAAEDEELQRALARYASLKRTLDGQDPIDAAAIPTVWSERTSDDGSLPYDAARIVSIEIGDAPWSGELRHHTFTIAHLHGRIRSVELECDGRKTRLRWKRGVEWGLPAGRDCTVTIEARRGSSFALYEFDQPIERPEAQPRARSRTHPGREQRNAYPDGTESRYSTGGQFDRDIRVNEVPLRVISSMATRSLLAELAERYREATGRAVDTEAAGGVDVAKRVRAGEEFDVVVLASDVIDSLIGESRLRPGRVDIVRSPIAVAVRAGAPRPDLGSEAAVKQAVEAARSLSYSTGPSGRHLEKVFERWGILDAIRDRIVVPPPGVPVASLVAEGKAEIGFQQLSELIGRGGIDVLGLVPAAIQSVTIFSAGVGAHSARSDEARELLEFLASPETAETKRRYGMEPAETAER